MSLFDGNHKGDERIRMVLLMLGEDPTASDSSVEFAARLLSKAEHQAERWLQNEIYEVLRGRAARNYLS